MSNDNLLRKLRYRLEQNSGMSPTRRGSTHRQIPTRPAQSRRSSVGGDEVLFKAGVVYQGTINMQTSGTAGKPIVYEGTGWGTGKAIMSGLTSAQLTFTADPSNPKLSVATLPAGLIPAGMSTETQSALNNIVEIDGKVSYMSNDFDVKQSVFPGSRRDFLFGLRNEGIRLLLDS